MRFSASEGKDTPMLGRSFRVLPICYPAEFKGSSKCKKLQFHGN